MHQLLMLALYISGIITIGSIMLMSPKWGLGVWLWGVQSSNEYGSKRSIEWSLKRAATICSIIFIACVLFLPYIK